jgi:hypothetical protein
MIDFEAFPATNTQYAVHAQAKSYLRNADSCQPDSLEDQVTTL